MDWIVSEEDSGISLLSFLSRQVSCSKREIKRFIDSSQCQVNGRVEKHATTKVRAGMHILLNYIEKPHLRCEKSRILYENEDFLAYDKPPFVSSDSSGIVALLSSYASPLFLVHRLDKLTSGVLLLAKNEVAKRDLEEAFKKRELEKTYLALVDGVLKEDQGLVADPVDGKSAETSWRCLQRYSDASLVRCFPRTGRKHQIRLHLLGLGHPVIGDTVYSRSFVCREIPQRHLLHASSIVFNGLKIEAPLPDDMVSFILKRTERLPNFEPSL